MHMTEKHGEQIIWLLSDLFLHHLCRDSCCCVAISKSQAAEFSIKAFDNVKLSKQAD